MSALRESRATLTRICRSCNETFTSQRSQSRFCSDACRVDFRVAEVKAVRDAEAAGPTCAFCGGPMPVTKRLNARYCTRFCKTRALNARVRDSERHQTKPSEYATLFKLQDGRCAICGTDKPGTTQRFFAVDHDHASDEVCGLLCYSCNVSLGYFRDDPDIPANAIAYLREPPARNAR